MVFSPRASNKRFVDFDRNDTEETVCHDYDLVLLASTLIFGLTRKLLQAFNTFSFLDTTVGSRFAIRELMHCLNTSWLTKFYTLPPLWFLCASVSLRL